MDNIQVHYDIVDGGIYVITSKNGSAGVVSVISLHTARKAINDLQNAIEQATSKGDYTNG